MKTIKESSLVLLLWFVIILLGSTFLFFLHVGITPFHAPIFLMITMLLYIFMKRKQNTRKEIVKVLITSLMIVLVSTVGMSFLYDRSSDGNTYHKDAIGLLKEGFNPVYESSEDFIKRRDDDSKEKTEYSIWADHYAKANWILAANFYSTTGNIESGKAMNIISAYILFSITLIEIVKVLDSRKAFLLALLVTFNPIVSSQLFTYYNDQLVCLYLFLSILCLIRIEHDFKNKENWMIYIASFIILANLKFNGLGYLLVFSFFFVCRFLSRAYKEKRFLPTFRTLCMIFIPLFIISLVGVGYPTYVKNTIDHQNPFFPLYDENGEDIITHQQPKKFQEMTNLEKLFYATFSKANNLRENEETTLKIPFTVSKDEITPATSIDLRISGWGVLFSGLLLCSIIILITKYKHYKKEEWIIYTLLVTTLLLLIMSESWWARYTPHFYLFVLISLYILMKYGKNKLLQNVYLLLIFANTLLPLAGNTFYTVKNSIQIRKELTSLKNQTIEVNLHQMNGILYNLKDFHIHYQLNDHLKGKELYYHYIEYGSDTNE